MVEARDDAKQPTIIPKHSLPLPQRMIWAGMSVMLMLGNHVLVYILSMDQVFSQMKTNLSSGSFPELLLLMLEQFHMT